MSDHAHDENGNCIPPQNGFYNQALPVWKFSMWDVAGLAVTAAAGIFGVLGQVGHMLARECAAQANFVRQNHDLRVAQEQAKAAQAWQAAERRAMAADLERLIEPREES